MRRSVTLAAALVVTAGLAVPAVAAGGAKCADRDWRMYGHDVAHTFAVPPGCSPITTGSVTTLVPAWFLHTTDSVTASPAVAGGTVYVGAWDGTFYAADAATGALRWTFRISAASPTAFGRIVSSAAVVDTPDVAGTRKRVVLFGGGSSLWALDGTTGRLLASVDLDPRTPADRAKDAANPRVAEVESSPAVVPTGADNGVRQQVFVGIDVHNGKGVGRTGLVSLILQPGKGDSGWSLVPRWKYDVETARVYRGAPGLTQGSHQGWGCGGVWSSPAVDVRAGLVVFGTASCDYPDDAQAAGENYAEEMVALRADTGDRVWSNRPADVGRTTAERTTEARRDADFGASANLLRLRDGRSVVGEGRKNNEYYVRDLAHGAQVHTVVTGQDGYLQDGFGIGGFLGSPGVQRAADGSAVRVIGATAVPVPRSPDDLDRTTWAVRAIDPAGGRVEWTYRLAGPSYGATSVVNGIALVADTTNSSVLALDAATGTLLWEAPVIGPPSSTPVVVGDSVYVGTGTRETDLEWKAFNNQLEDAFGGTVGESPLSPVSGVQAFRLAGG